MTNSIRYTNQEETFVDIQPEKYLAPYPGSQFDYLVDEWIAGGNIITPYDEFYEVTDEQLREQNYVANSVYADSIILSAESNPVAGQTLDAKATEKANKRRANKAKSNKAMTDTDDELSDYIDSCMDALDNADDVVETLTRQQLIDWDPTTWAYPVWTPTGA